MIEKIYNQKKLYALIVRRDYQKKTGVNFFTDKESTQQFAYMNHKKNHIIFFIIACMFISTFRSKRHTAELHQRGNSN